MTTYHRLIVVAAFAAGVMATATLVQAQTSTRDAELVTNAATVFDEIMATPDKAIPETILEKASAIAVFPGMLRAGFVFGGQRGHGVMSVRDPKTGAWSAPAFLTITGGSWGAQIGGQSIDLVLVIRDERGVQNLARNQFKIGGEASAAAGPVGRSAEAATDVQMRAQILSYSRSRGLFAGVAVNGSSVREDMDANERVYGTPLRTRNIVFEHRGDTPAAVRPWLDVLNKYVRGR